MRLLAVVATMTIHDRVVLVRPKLTLLGRGGLETLLSAGIRIANLQSETLFSDRDTVKVLNDFIADFTRLKPSKKLAGAGVCV